MAKWFLYALGAALAFMLGATVLVLAVPYIFVAFACNLAVVLAWLTKRGTQATLGKLFRHFWIRTSSRWSYRAVTTRTRIPRWQSGVLWVLCQLSYHPE